MDDFTPKAISPLPAPARRVHLPSEGMAQADMVEAGIPARYWRIGFNPLLSPVGRALQAWWDDVQSAVEARRDLVVVAEDLDNDSTAFAAIFRRLCIAEGLEWPPGAELWPPRWVDAATIDRDFKAREAAEEAGLLAVAGVGMTYLTPEPALGVLRTLAWQRYQAGKITLWLVPPPNQKGWRVANGLIEHLGARAHVCGTLPTLQAVGQQTGSEVV